MGWINASPRGAPNAHDQLRQVLSYATATIIHAACVHTPVTAAMIGADGLIADTATRDVIVQALTNLAGHATKGDEHTSR